MEPTDPKRNDAAEKGRKNDPGLRDNSAIQPGTNTISRSDTDPANQKLTETAKDGFRTGKDQDQTADTRFDEE